MSSEVDGWPAWRETATQLTEDQMDGLLGSALTDAEHLVRRHGEFYPFALVCPLGSDEPQALMVGEDLGDDVPDSAQLLERTWELLGARRGDYDAVAVVSDVYVNGESAISVALEHRAGVRFTILRLYRAKRLGRGGKLGELTGQLSEPRIWA